MSSLISIVGGKLIKIENGNGKTKIFVEDS